jgi:hypothetical protein
MTTIVEGFYKQGKIELQEIPTGLQEGPVRVILMAQEPSKPPPTYLTFGMYPGDTSTLGDFRDAQWHGEEEFDNPPHLAGAEVPRTALCPARGRRASPAPLAGGVAAVVVCSGPGIGRGVVTGFPVIKAIKSPVWLIALIALVCQRLSGKE